MAATPSPQPESHPESQPGLEPTSQSTLRPGSQPASLPGSPAVPPPSSSIPGPAADLIASRSPFEGTEALARTVETLIADGLLPPGSRLPTIRSLARLLGVSPTTVAGAWRTLVEHGTIETRGRGGTFVATATGRPSRSWLSGPPGRYRLDLSSGTPDPDLLPDLSTFLADRGRTPAQAASYLGPVMLPELEERVRAALPYDPERVTVVDGTLDALDRLMADHLRRGSTVIVEDPCFPPVAELAEIHGGRLLPVSTDPGGIAIEELRTALATRPTMLVVQPRANNPTGVSMTAERVEQLATVVASSGAELLVVEDDSGGDISVSPPVSLGRHLPDRVVHIRSYSKSHGPDLRLAAVCGPASVIDPLVERRRLGPIWSPRILQEVLAGMLVDIRVVETVARARRTYADRRHALVAALDRLGVATVGGDGFNVWMPVHNERDAMVALAAEGIGVTPGTPFQLRPGGHPHVRITASEELDDVAGVAALLAEAALPAQRGGRFVV